MMNKSILGAAAIAALASAASAGNYTVTVTNNLDEELLAPILITNTGNDGGIFSSPYVTPEAEEQILTGDPGKLVARIGPDAVVGHGSDGPPGVLLAPGNSVTFDIETDAASVRVLAMIAPTIVPDNYVTNVVNLNGIDMTEIGLDRFDIGHDEGSMAVMASGGMMAEGSDSPMAMEAMHSVATVTFTKKM